MTTFARDLSTFREFAVVVDTSCCPQCERNYVGLLVDGDFAVGTDGGEFHRTATGWSDGYGDYPEVSR